MGRHGLGDHGHVPDDAGHVHHRDGASPSRSASNTTDTTTAQAIPRITSDFHSLQDVGWYGSAYLISTCAFQPLAGKLYTCLRSKNAFFGFLAGFELGSVLCGVAVNSKMLIVGRAVAGLAASGLTNGALTIVAASAPLHKRPAMLGVMISGRFLCSA